MICGIAHHRAQLLWASRPAVAAARHRV